MIQLMPPFLDADATHGKGDDHVSLFDKGVIQVAAVHASIGRCGDRSGRRIQTFDFGGQIGRANSFGRFSFLISTPSSTNALGRRIRFRG